MLTNVPDDPASAPHDEVRIALDGDADRLQLRGLLLQGAVSAPAAPADASYFTTLRDRVQKHAHR